jgi:hypothetical protein
MSTPGLLFARAARALSKSEKTSQKAKPVGIITSVSITASKFHF